MSHAKETSPQPVITTEQDSLFPTHHHFTKTSIDHSLYATEVKPTEKTRSTSPFKVIRPKQRKRLNTEGNDKNKNLLPSEIFSITKDLIQAGKNRPVLVNRTVDSTHNQFNTAYSDKVADFKVPTTISKNGLSLKADALISSVNSTLLGERNRKGLGMDQGLNAISTLQTTPS